MGICNPSGNPRLALYNFASAFILFTILVLILRLPFIALATALPGPIASPRPQDLYPVSPISKVPQEFASTAAPPFDFPGSVTVCRRDYHEDCTTLVELPGSVQRRCTRVPQEFNDRISSLEIKNGCCEFFRGFGCTGGRLLTLCNERKGTLFGITNNQISSWNCYFGDK